MSGGAVVTVLSPQLPPGCQLAPPPHGPTDGGSIRANPPGRKLFTAGIKRQRCWYLLHGSHGPLLLGKIEKIDPRHRAAADSPCLRRGAVRLSGQPFPEPRTRQYLDGCPCRRRALPYHVLAISAGRDRVLWRGHDSQRARNLGAVPAPAVSLEGDRAAAARA